MAGHGYRRGVVGMVLLLLAIGGIIAPSWGQQEGVKARESRFSGTVVGTVENALVLRSSNAKSPDYLVPIHEKTHISLDYTVSVSLAEVSAGGHALVAQNDGLTMRIDIISSKASKEGDLSQRPVTTGLVVKNENNTLHVKVGWGASAREVAVVVSDETIIRSEGEKIPLAKIAVGQTVTVVRKDGKVMRVMAQPPKKK